MKEIKIDTDYIKLDQFLKLTDTIRTGGEAKLFIAQNDIYVNNERETRRGRKLRGGDIININDKEEYKIVQNGGQT
ncbi:MAG TPA: S4 domain-containing protein YaaA [Clostridiaceae bacterium]|nr:S4 domain-containing protein YaaA [Clostridiaceae bacterium]